MLLRKTQVKRIQVKTNLVSRAKRICKSIKGREKVSKYGRQFNYSHFLTSKVFIAEVRELGTKGDVAKMSNLVCT